MGLLQKKVARHVSFVVQRGVTSSELAANQLQVIRALMQRATIYRAISLPTALVGGTLSLLAFGLISQFSRLEKRSLTAPEFVATWLLVLLLTALANGLFLWSKSQRRGEPFFSSGMKLAALSLAPAFVSAGLFTCVTQDARHLTIAWILFYGIGLLSTQHFAPRSLIVLGLAFFLTGAALLVASPTLDVWFGPPAVSPVAASAIMATTFGGFHLLYALLVWVGGEDTAKVSTPTSEASHV